MELKIDSDGLAEYIKAVLSGINKGIAQEEDSDDEAETFTLSGPVKFRVGLTNISERKGEVKLFVMGLGGGASKGGSNEQHATIEFEVTDSTITFFRMVDNLQTVYGRLSESQRQYVDKLLADLGKAIGTFLKQMPASSSSQLPP
jgi:hypothetical protein